MTITVAIEEGATMVRIGSLFSLGRGANSLSGEMERWEKTEE